MVSEDSLSYRRESCSSLQEKLTLARLWATHTVSTEKMEDFVDLLRNSWDMIPMTAAQRREVKSEVCSGCKTGRSNYAHKYRNLSIERPIQPRWGFSLEIVTASSAYFIVNSVHWLTAVTCLSIYEGNVAMVFNFKLFAWSYLMYSRSTHITVARSDKADSIFVHAWRPICLVLPLRARKHRGFA